MHLNAKCIAFSKRDGQVVTQLSCAAGPDEVAGTHVLLAVGRRPNTDDLGLDKAGIELDQRGYIVLTINCAPAYPASGLRAIALGEARSRIRHSMILRSSRPTCWMTTRGGLATASQPTARTSIRRSGGPASPKTKYARIRGRRCLETVHSLQHQLI